MVHYDLFAGVGGFSYALDHVFYDRAIKHIFCEWGAFPTAVLKKHWPDATYYGDIADLVADTDSKRWAWGGREDARRHGQFSGEVPHQEQEMVILTGGFPCQPFSHAGRRQGTADDRYKWPEMFAVIQNVKPNWVIAENVRGLVTWNDGMVLETVCADLESEGYEVQPIIIPACAIGAPHRRDRVWIIANRNNPRSETSAGNVRPKDREENSKEWQHSQHWACGQGSTTSNSRQQLREQGGSEGVEADTAIGTTRSETNKREHQYSWETDWREVALATCYDGVDDGLSRRMDGTALSAARHRKERLKACGNAIVPQVAMQIFQAIKLAEA